MSRRMSAARMRRIAAIDYEPVVIPEMMSVNQFRVEAGQVFVQAKLAASLLALCPKDMAAAIQVGQGESFLAALESLSTAVDWMETWRELLSCARARVAIGLAKADVAGGA